MTTITCRICNKIFSCAEPIGVWDRELQIDGCPHRTFTGCVTRERALAAVIFDKYPREALPAKTVYECSPANRGLSHWLQTNCPKFVGTGYFPDKPFGTFVHGLRNEDMESLTLEDSSVDIWLHLDVLEHLFAPFKAMREVFRTLRPGGHCFFTAPTYAGREKSEQVAYREPGGTVRIVGEPEYHGNPQNPQGSLVTWRYGYDLPQRLWQECAFDVEVRRWWAPSIGVAGPMTEVYICTKPAA